MFTLLGIMHTYVAMKHEMLFNETVIWPHSKIKSVK